MTAGDRAPFKAMIMAAGFGTRLLPLTELTAKPMVPILNRPVMEHILRLLAAHGVREVAANLHYHPDLIREYFGDGSEYGLHLRYAVEEELLGTAGGVGGFRDFLSDGPFVVVSGDALTDVDLTSFMAAHRSRAGVASLAVIQVEDPSQYGVVVHDPHGRVTGFQEKPLRDEALSFLGNCGIYALEPRIFDYIPAGRFVDFAHDVFPALLGADDPFFVWQLDGYWNDVGNIAQYRRGNFDALSGRVDVHVPGRQVDDGVWIGDGTVVDPSARIVPPVLIGERCRVDADASLNGPLIIGDDCVIEEGALLDGVIHWNGGTTGRYAQAFGGILGRGVKVHHDAEVGQGAVVGDGTDVAPHAVVGPGARIRPHSHVTLDDLAGDAASQTTPDDAAADDAAADGLGPGSTAAP